MCENAIPLDSPKEARQKNFTHPPPLNILHTISIVLLLLFLLVLGLVSSNGDSRRSQVIDQITNITGPVILV